MRPLIDLLERAQKRATELEGEVRWLRSHIEEVNLEVGGLREVLEKCFREIDEIFSASPALIRAQYAEVQKNEDAKTRPGKNWSEGRKDKVQRCRKIQAKNGQPHRTIVVSQRDIRAITSRSYALRTI
jgi:hypothetical protein